MIKRRLFQVEYAFGAGGTSDAYIVAEDFEAALATFRAHRQTVKIVRIVSVRQAIVFVEGDA